MDAKGSLQSGIKLLAADSEYVSLLRQAMVLDIFDGGERAIGLMKERYDEAYREYHKPAEHDPGDHEGGVGGLGGGQSASPPAGP